MTPDEIAAARRLAADMRYESASPRAGRLLRGPKLDCADTIERLCDEVERLLAEKKFLADLNEQAIRVFSESPLTEDEP